MPTCPKCLGNRHLTSQGTPAYGGYDASIQCPECNGFGFVNRGHRGGGRGRPGIPLSGSARTFILIAGGIGGLMAYSAHAPDDFAYIAAVLGFLVLAACARIAVNFATAPIQMFLGVAFLVGLDHFAFENVGIRWLGTHGVRLVGGLFTG